MRSSHRRHASADRHQTKCVASCADHAHHPATSRRFVFLDLDTKAADVNMLIKFSREEDELDQSDIELRQLPRKVSEHFQVAVCSVDP